ncbi:hypothetical protein HG530_009136, partial [Fusarium avenaceum]
RGFENMFWYACKAEIRDYFPEVNKNQKVIECTFFHPGLFANYMTYPFNSSKYIQLFKTLINFHQRLAFVGRHEDVMITLTAVQDTAQVVALAIEHKGQ